MTRNVSTSRNYFVSSAASTCCSSCSSLYLLVCTTTTAAIRESDTWASTVAVGSFIRMYSFPGDKNTEETAVNEDTPAFKGTNNGTEIDLHKEIFFSIDVNLITCKIDAK